MIWTHLPAVALAGLITTAAGAAPQAQQTPAAARGVRGGSWRNDPSIDIRMTRFREEYQP